MKSNIVFTNVVKVIESGQLSNSEIQTVIRLLAAQFPKPKKKKVAKVETPKTVLPPHYRTLKKKD